MACLAACIVLSGNIFISTFYGNTLCLGLCISLSSAACGDDCRAKGGNCLWKNPGDGSDYLGSCREGKWGEGDGVCYCGSCYGGKCEQTPNCKGKCQKTSPGYGYTSTVYCNKYAFCLLFYTIIIPYCS